MNEMPARTTTPRPLWRNRAFNLLFGAQIISTCADGLNPPDGNRGIIKVRPTKQAKAFLESPRWQSGDC